MIMKFSPTTGERDDPVYKGIGYTAEQYRQMWPKAVWLYDPMTGKKRQPEDVAALPQDLKNHQSHAIHVIMFSSNNETESNNMNRESITLFIVGLAILLTFSLAVFNVVLGGIAGTFALVVAYVFEVVTPVHSYRVR